MALVKRIAGLGTRMAREYLACQTACSYLLLIILYYHRLMSFGSVKHIFMFLVILNTIFLELSCDGQECQISGASVIIKTCFPKPTKEII